MFGILGIAGAFLCSLSVISTEALAQSTNIIPIEEGNKICERIVRKHIYDVIDQMLDSAEKTTRKKILDVDRWYIQHKAWSGAKRALEASYTLHD